MSEPEAKAKTIPSFEPPKGACEIAGTIQEMPVVWGGPFLERGLHDTVFEWIGKIDAPSILSGAAAILIANYIWEIIKGGREKTSAGKTKNSTGTALPPLPPFAEASRVRINISKKEETIEIDALTIDRDALISKLRDFLADEASRK
ncbi:MAG TPA: hypothetical protein VG347_09275 [Verrucomicrobiae bacterium]|nr:hypothetical protein [Verrucomicrobiae bacterium]